MQLAQDAEEMLNYLKRYDITHLYHFTDIENLPLIFEMGGLVSKQKLENHGLLESIKTGGNPLSKELDEHWGNWDKVSLSWASQLPMAYYREQEQHLCYIVVKLGAVSYTHLTLPTKA